jgi:DNA-binding NarL/FixJ family response regulator
MSVRILLADDHSIVRRGLRNLLESRRGWKVCGEAADGRAAVSKAAQLKPDAAILDVGMPELNGIEATRRIREVSPDTEILILSAHASERLAREVLEAGARGYLLKEEADQDLLVAVEAIRKHRPYFTPRLGEWTTRQTKEPRSERRSSLTPREREIAQLLAEGRTNKQVATALGTAVKTVETHRANIMLKLNLHSITELVHYAIRNEMIHMA